jgi:hypothetical protein
MDPSEVVIGSSLRNLELDPTVGRNAFSEKSVLLHREAMMVGQRKNELVAVPGEHGSRVDVG